MKKKIKKLYCIWCGRLDDGKMARMLVDIIYLMKHKDSICVRMVGTGVFENVIKQDINQKKLSDSIILKGQLPRDTVGNIFKNSFLHILKSILSFYASEGFRV